MAIVFNPFLTRGGGTMNLGISEMTSELWDFLNGESSVLDSNDVLKLYSRMPSHVTEVHIPNCSYVGDRAFLQCNMLSSLELADNVKIGFEAFYGAFVPGTRLFLSAKEIDVSAFGECHFSEIQLRCSGAIGFYTFHGCSELQTAWISAPRLENYAFMYCSSLHTLYLNCMTLMTSALADVSALSSIYLLADLPTYASPGFIRNYGMSSYSGLIYVPSHLMSLYMSQSCWASLSNQIVPIQEGGKE